MHGFERMLLVGVGGFIGSVARYLAGAATARALPPTFPFGTFVVNVLGCLLIGALAVLTDERLILGTRARLFLLVGVLGGFTTFSSFGYETIMLLRQDNQLHAAINVVSQMTAGLVAVWMGAVLMRGLL